MLGAKRCKVDLLYPRSCAKQRIKPQEREILQGNLTIMLPIRPLRMKSHRFRSSILETRKTKDIRLWQLPKSWLNPEMLRKVDTSSSLGGCT